MTSGKPMARPDIVRVRCDTHVQAHTHKHTRKTFFTFSNSITVNTKRERLQEPMMLLKQTCVLKTTVRFRPFFYFYFYFGVWYG